MTPEKTKAEIMKAIKKRRETLKWSQAKVAELSGVGLATTQRIEYGTFWPNLKQLLAVCESLGLNIEISE